MHQSDPDSIAEDIESFWRNVFSRRAPVYVPRRLFQSVQRFVQLEASSGIVLLLAVIAALVWANSNWNDAYLDLINTHLVLDIAILRLDESVQHWVNDGLMTLFFFLMGLEIKRERNRVRRAYARQHGRGCRTRTRPARQRAPQPDKCWYSARRLD